MPFFDKFEYCSSSTSEEEERDRNDWEVRKLYIWLGSDKIVSLNVNDLNKYPSYDVFSLPTTIGTTYYSGGFFVMDSKLHYLGGGGPEFKFNKKVFSFNLPSLAQDDSTCFPDHSDCKLKPIVFTISNKVYALSTFPISDISQPSFFEVYEPDNGKWRSLPAPPIPHLSAVISHCVFRNNLLLQTFFGDFVFDAQIEMWKLTAHVFPKCCAVLEYEDLLLVLTREPFKLLAYELASFGEIGEMIYSPPHVVEIEENYFDFSKLSIVWASLNYVGNKCICLVFISGRHNFHVSLFKVSKTNDIICGHVVACYGFPISIRRSPKFLHYSTFFWCGEANYQQYPTVSLHDGTMAVSNCESPESDWAEEEMDRNGLEDRKLYIWLGFDSIFSIGLDDLKVYPSDLPTIGTEYTLGGFFVVDSKLHFLGGGGHEFKFNKKVFSFNLPSFMPDPSSHFPDHSHCMLSPIVFIISNNVYALSTFFPFAEIPEPIFEVYDPVDENWRTLPEPAIPALYTIKNHFVLQNKLVLQTHYGDFIFDASLEEWGRAYMIPECFAVLEYKDIILVLTREPSKLVAYKLASFGEFNCSSHVVEIEKNYFDFSKLGIHWASLNHVGSNCFCLVFISHMYTFHVSLFKVLKANGIIYGHVKAYHEFDVPIRRSLEIRHYSTFFWCVKANQQDPTVSVHDDTKELGEKGCLEDF